MKSNSYNLTSINQVEKIVYAAENLFHFYSAEKKKKKKMKSLQTPSEDIESSVAKTENEGKCEKL